MKVKRHFLRLAQFCVVLCLTFAFVAPLPSAVRKWALVAPASSKLQDIPLADLVKFCKGTQKAWADGRNFAIVIHDPELPEMRSAVEKLFGVDALEVKPLIAKLNESRTMIKVVQTDEELIRAVEATPGAIGLVDVYAINSSVKVLRIDGKLPFDTGYALKGN
jgi:ribosomal protein L23